MDLMGFNGDFMGKNGLWRIKSHLGNGVFITNSMMEYDGIWMGIIKTVQTRDINSIFLIKTMNIGYNIKNGDFMKQKLETYWLIRLMNHERSKVGWCSLWNPEVWVYTESNYLDALKWILKWIWNMGRLCCSSEYESHGVVAWPAIVFGSLEQYMLPIQVIIIVSNSNFITRYHCRTLNKS